MDFLANVCTFRVGSSIESRSLELEGSVRHISTDHRDRTGTDYLFAVMVPDRGDHPSRLPCSPVLLALSHMSNPTLPTYSVQPKRIFAKTETGCFQKPKFGRNIILSRNNPISAKTALFLPKWSCICQKSHITAETSLFCHHKFVSTSPFRLIFYSKLVVPLCGS